MLQIYCFSLLKLVLCCLLVCRWTTFSFLCIQAFFRPYHCYYISCTGSVLHLLFAFVDYRHLGLNSEAYALQGLELLHMFQYHNRPIQWSVALISVDTTASSIHPDHWTFVYHLLDFGSHDGSLVDHDYPHLYQNYHIFGFFYIVLVLHFYNIDVLSIPLG